MYEYYIPGGKFVFYPNAFPPQCQPFQPGIESVMVPRPVSEDPNYVACCKLKDKVAIITGGDSGIGKAAAIAFAKEGADVVIAYGCAYESGDALETKKRIEEIGRRCVLLVGNIADEAFCNEVVRRTIEIFGRLDILVNNAAVAVEQKGLEDVSSQQLETTFRINIFSCFYLTKAALPYLKKGSAIINTVSVVAYMGKKSLIDYSSTKGAMVAFTRSLSLSLADKGIRVNGIAPGDVWTPLVPGSTSALGVVTFGRERPLGRAAQPAELAPAFVFLASETDSGQMTGQVLHMNGGTIVNG